MSRKGKSGRRIVLCGWNKNVDHVVESLKTVNDDGRLGIVLVNSQDKEVVEDLISRSPTVDFKFVQGDYTRESVLQGANLKDCAAAIILSSDRFSDRSKPDEKTIFACLAIKSLYPDVKVLACLAERDNLDHLRRANADEIILNADLDAFLVASRVLDPGVPQTVEALLTRSSGARLRTVGIPPEFVDRSFTDLFDHFWKEHSWILISVFLQEERIGVKEILAADTSSLDAFIERKLKEAGYRLEEESRKSVVINPEGEYMVKKNERAIVIQSHLDA
ncbi:MAG: NAD(P)-binding protein [Candidatus Neomarinimicrobiota bacterium]